MLRLFHRAHKFYLQIFNATLLFNDDLCTTFSNSICIEHSFLCCCFAERVFVYWKLMWCHFCIKLSVFRSEGSSAGTTQWNAVNWRCLCRRCFLCILEMKLVIKLRLLIGSERRIFWKNGETNLLLRHSRVVRRIILRYNSFILLVCIL